MPPSSKNANVDVFLHSKQQWLGISEHHRKVPAQETPENSRKSTDDPGTCGLWSWFILEHAECGAGSFFTCWTPVFCTVLAQIKCSINDSQYYWQYFNFYLYIKYRQKAHMNIYLCIFKGVHVCNFQTGSGQ